MSDYQRLSSEHPLEVSIYPHARDARGDAAERVAFKSLDDVRARFQEPLVRAAKELVPLMTRARCDGDRKLENMRGPWWVVLDVDGSAVTPEAAHVDLRVAGVGHLLHTTYSHAPERGENRFRVLTDFLAQDRADLEGICRLLFEVIGAEPTIESWSGLCFYVPGVSPERRSTWTLMADPSPSIWVPQRIERGERDDAQEQPVAAEAEPEGPADPDEVRDALAVIPNADRGEWVKVGMCLHKAEAREQLEPGVGRRLWDEWSAGQDYPSYSDEEQERRWSSFRDKPGGVGLGSLFRTARQAGWRRGRAGRVSPREDFAARELGAIMRYTHAWNADRLVREHRHELQFVEALSSWIRFDGKRWLMDRGLCAKQLAKGIAIRIFQDATELSGNESREALRWAKASNMANGIAGTLDLAKPALAISSRRLDSDPMRLNLANGTLDLRTHELRPHDSADLITKMAPTDYDPGARCEHWERFLEEVLPDVEVRRFFQRLMGYTLQGRQDEKVFAIVHGPPNGGKSTAINACTRALGTSTRDAAAAEDDDSGAVTRHYAEGTGIATFRAQRGAAGNRPELAKLMGARLVVVNEIRGEELESSVMKAWTGGDLIQATPKYGHPLGFYADGTIFLVGNELPKIEFEDDAMWERVAVVAFPLALPDERRDRSLASRFDLRGVLAWMVEGHSEYRRVGLCPPPSSRLAKADYRRDSDPLAEFWEDCVEVVDSASADATRVSTEALHTRYTFWAQDAGVPTSRQLTRSALTRAAKKRAELTGQYRWRRSGSFKGWEGIRLVQDLSALHQQFMPEGEASAPPGALAGAPE